MAVVKKNGFTAPYRSQTFQEQARLIESKNGVLEMDGGLSELSGDLTIPPIVFLQNGLIVSNDAAKLATVPPDLVEPFYITVTSPTTFQNDDLVYRFVKGPSELTIDDVIIGEKSNGEWREKAFVTQEELCKSVDSLRVQAGLAAPLSGLKTTFTGSVFETAPGELIDKKGQQAAVESIVTTSPHPDDVDWPRVDRIVFRRPCINEDRIGEVVHLLGGTFSAGAQQGTPVNVFPVAVPHGAIQALVLSDNSLVLLTAEGYGETFDLFYTRYDQDRVTELVAPVAIATGLSSDKFDALVDSSDDIYIAYRAGDKIVSSIHTGVTGTISGSSVDISADDTTHDEVTMSQFPNGKIAYVFTRDTGGGITELYFNIKTDGLSPVTGPSALVTGGDHDQPVVEADFNSQLHFAYRDASTDEILYAILDDNGDAIEAAQIISGATEHPTHGTLANPASKPDILVSTTEQVVVAFLQEKPSSNKGLATWSTGETGASMLDLVNASEDIDNYDFNITEVFGALHYTLGLANDEIHYVAILDDAAYIGEQLSASDGSISVSAVLDKAGSLVHAYTKKSPGTFTNYGTNDAVSEIGPQTVTGTLNNISLSANQMLIAEANKPKVGDEVTTTGSGAGNDGAFIVTGVETVSQDAVNDFARVTMATSFAAAESGSVSAQKASPDGMDGTFVKTVSETAVNAYLVAERAEDNLLARIIQPGDIIINYFGENGNLIDSDTIGLYGDVIYGWESTSANTLDITNSLMLVDFINNVEYTLAPSSASLNEDEALYTILDGSDFTPTYQVAPINELPLDEPIIILGFRKGGKFQPHFLMKGDVGTLDSGEVATIGTDLPQASRVRLGITSDTTLEAYTSVNTIALPDSYPTALSKLDAALTGSSNKSNYDRTLKLVEGGTWHWDLVAEELKFSAIAYVQLADFADDRNRIQAAQSPIDLSSDDVAYVELNRTTDSATNLVVQTEVFADLVPTDNTFIIARRVGDNIYLSNGVKLSPGQRIEIDSVLDELDRFLRRLDIVPDATDPTLIRITGPEKASLDGSKLNHVLEDLMMDPDFGAVFNPKTGEVFESDGTTPLGEDLVPPPTVAANQFRWFGIAVVPGVPNAKNQMGAVLSVTFGDADSATADAGQRPPLEGDIPLGWFYVQRNAGDTDIEDITFDNIVRAPLSSSGGGGGGIVETIRDFDIPGDTATTVTFPNEVYEFGNQTNFFFRNGLLLTNKLGVADPFSTDPFVAATEYKEVDAGSVSNQILINPIVAAGPQTRFDLLILKNIEEGPVATDRNLKTAETLADGTGAKDCTVASTATETIVSLVGFNYNPNQFPGETRRDINVYVNGQEVSFLIPGKNDQYSGILCEDNANGTDVHVYEWDADTLTKVFLPDDALIKITKEFYFLNDFSAILTHIIAGVNDIYDIGSGGNKFRDLFLSRNADVGNDLLVGNDVFVDAEGLVWIGDGAFRWNDDVPGNELLEFRHKSGDAWQPIGSGGGGGSDILKALTEEELGQLVSVDPKSLLDAMNANIGALVNMTKIASALRLNFGQTTGTYELTKQITSKAKDVEGVAVVSLQAAAIKSIATNDLIIAEDVTAEFPDTSKVLIAHKLEQNGSTDHVFLLDEVNNVPARLVVGSTAYSAINNETTITLLNPDALDLTMGVPVAEQRVMPFDDTVEVTGTGPGGYEEADLDDLNGIDNVRLEGSNFYKIIQDLDGSIDKLDGDMSANGQYGIIRVLENGADGGTNDLWHFYYSVDRGNTWTKLAGTDGIDTNTVNELNDNFNLASNTQLGVADNGKFFVAMPVKDGNWFVEGRYGDLTIPTPVLNPSADRGAGLGIIGKNPATNMQSMISFDRADMSLVQVSVLEDDNSDTHPQFTDGGATFLGSWSTTGLFGYGQTCISFVTGTAPNHESHVLMENTGNLISYYRADEGETGSIGSLIAVGAENSIHGADINSQYLAFTVESGTSQMKLYKFDHTLVTPVATNVILTGTKGPQIYQENGTDTVADHNHNKVVKNNVRFNPSDDKHLFIAWDGRQISGNSNIQTFTQGMLAEIKDITTFTGVVDVSDTVGNQFTLDGGTWRGEVTSMTAGDKVRTVVYQLFKSSNGVIDGADKTMTLEIYATSGGLPTGAPLATSADHTTDYFSPESDANAYFHLDWEVPTTAQYAVIIRANYDNTADQLRFRGSSTGSQVSSTNGTVWQQDNVGSLVYQLLDYWLDRLGEGRPGQIQGQAAFFNDWENQLRLIDSNQIKFSARTTIANSSGRKRYSGVPSERTINISNTAAKSTYTDLICSVYNENGPIPDFDRNLTFAVALGALESQGRDLVTGVTVTGAEICETSHVSIPVVIGASTPLAINDSDFQTGRAIPFNGSSHHASYSDFGQQYIGTQKFIIEAEVKNQNVTTGQDNTIISTHNGAAAGWVLTIRNGGELEFWFNGGSTPNVDRVQASDITEPENEYYKVRAVGDAQSIKLYRSRGAALTAGPNGSSVFTEVASYSSAVTSGYNIINSTDVLRVGRYRTQNYFEGWMGYIKMAVTKRGTPEFAYDGWKDQRAVTSHQNIGSNLIIGKRVLQSYTGAGAYQYYDFGVARDGAPWVDSYDISAWYKKTLTTPGREIGVRLTKNRGSDFDQTSYQGINFKFIK